MALARISATRRGWCAPSRIERSSLLLLPARGRSGDGRGGEEASTLPGPPWSKAGDQLDGAGALLLGRPAEASGSQYPAAAHRRGRQPDRHERVQMRAWVEFGKDFDSRDWRKARGSRAPRGSHARHVVCPAPSTKCSGRRMFTRAPGGMSLAQLSLVHFLRGEWALASGGGRGGLQSSSRAPARVPSSARLPPARLLGRSKRRPRAPG